MIYMKLRYINESNYPDNVSELDPHFYPTEVSFDPSEVKFAKIDYSGTDIDGDVFDETLYVDKFGGNSFVDEVLDNAEGIVRDYIDDDTCTITNVGNIIFVDYDGNEFPADEIQ